MPNYILKDLTVTARGGKNPILNLIQPGFVFKQPSCIFVFIQEFRFFKIINRLVQLKVGKKLFKKTIVQQQLHQLALNSSGFNYNNAQCLDFVSSDKFFLKQSPRRLRRCACSPVTVLLSVPRRVACPADNLQFL